MRRWIVFGCGALALGAAAWYFGRPSRAPAPATTRAVAEVAPVETAKEPPPKVIEVIDLARAYEPVPEPEETLPGGVDPATLIPVADAPERIPYAVEDEGHWFRDLVAAVRRTPLGGILFGPGEVPAERIEVMPRQVLSFQDWLLGVHRGGVGLKFRREEPLDVMPREVK
jgi:hypothetical protein